MLSRHFNGLIFGNTIINNCFFIACDQSVFCRKIGGDVMVKVKQYFDGNSAKTKNAKKLDFHHEYFVYFKNSNEAIIWCQNSNIIFTNK